MIATKVIPLLVTFLVNKSGTKAEFERYHECVTKFITRIKDKRLQDLQSNPFKAKAEEPEEAVLQTPTLDSLLNQAKADGFDNLFAKQNQIGGHQNQQQKPMEFGLPNPGADNGGFDFGDFNSFPTQPGANVTGGFSLGGSTSNNGSAVGTPTPQTASGGGFSLPKPPEKTQTTHFKPPTISAQSGGLGLMDLGFGMPQSTNTTNKQQNSFGMNNGGNNNGFGMGMNSLTTNTNPSNNNSMGLGGFGMGGLGNTGSGNSGTGKSNYSAFDEFTLNDDAGSTNVLGLGGLGGTSGGMGGGLGLGSNSGGIGGFGGSAMGSGGLGGNTGGLGMGNNGFGSFGGMGSTNNSGSSGMGGLGSGGFGGMGSSDPFSKSSMGGLMLGETKDPFDFTSMGSNKGNPGSGMGYSNNLLGIDNSGGSNLLGGNNFGMSGMGSINMMGSNTMGGFGGSNSNSQNQGGLGSSKPGGLFSNPNLVVKGSSNTNQNSKPAGSSNFNDFNLL